MWSFTAEIFLKDGICSMSFISRQASNFYQTGNETIVLALIIRVLFPEKVNPLESNWGKINERKKVVVAQIGNCPVCTSSTSQ